MQRRAVEHGLIRNDGEGRIAARWNRNSRQRGQLLKGLYPRHSLPIAEFPRRVSRYVLANSSRVSSSVRIGDFDKRQKLSPILEEHLLFRTEGAPIRAEETYASLLQCLGKFNQIRSVFPLANQACRAHRSGFELGWRIRDWNRRSGRHRSSIIEIRRHQLT